MGMEHQIGSKPKAPSPEDVAAQTRSKDAALQRDAALALQQSRVSPRSLSPAAILVLQRTIGNAAVTRLLAQHPGRGMDRGAQGPGWAAPGSIQREIADKKDQEQVSGLFEQQLKALGLAKEFYLTGKVLPYVLKTESSVGGAERAVRLQLRYLSDLSKVQEKGGEVKPTDFATAGEAREAKFVELASSRGISAEVAKELFGAARSDVKADTVTGFDLAGDRIPTVENALAYIKQHPTVGAYYVEVDVKNLGGLNAALGHSKADEVYGQMARIAEGKMMGLPAKVGRFRHAGDEFSFVVVGQHVTSAMVDMTLAEASGEIASYISRQKLSGIAHPKHPQDEKKQGTGIVYGISTMLPTDSVQTVLSAADQRVEAKKQA